MLRIDDADRIRTITLDRPDALNAFNEALYDATTDALLDAAADPSVAVVVITGSGRAFSAGTDVVEMASRTTNPDFQAGRHGFPGLPRLSEPFRSALQHHCGRRSPDHARGDPAARSAGDADPGA